MKYYSLFLLPLFPVLFWFFGTLQNAEDELVDEPMEFGGSLSEPMVYNQIVESASAEASCPCIVSQGSFSAPFPFVSTPQSNIEFYAYGVPTGSSANTGFEQSEQLILILHENTNTGEVSFVFVGDDVNDGSGGTMTLTLTCLPNSAYVAVSDDNGEFSGTPPTMSGDFFWAPCCTDGGAVGGVGCGTTFTLNPDDVSGFTTIALGFGSPSNPQYTDLPSLDCPIIINCGGQACCENVFFLDAFVQNASCEGNMDGLIDLTVTGECLTPLTYQWSNGEMTEDIAGLAPGDYTVTVTDVNGCTEEETFTVGVDFTNPEPEIIGTPFFCEGESVLLSVNGFFTDYQWSNGDNGPVTEVFQGGTYTVTVTNAGGCTGTASYDVVENPAPEPEITGPTEICPGDILELDAGPGFVTYQWTTGSVQQTTFITEPGAYTVFVTNQFGCQGTDTYDVIGLPAPDPVINGPTSLCQGEGAVLTVEPIFASYLWSTGETDPDIEITTPGVYSITVTNAEGCEGIDQWIVEENAIIPTDISGDSLVCPGDSATLTAVGSYAEYQWSTGENSSQINAPGPGAYSLTVTNIAGCTDAATFEVDTFAAPVASITGQTVICPGDSTVLGANQEFVLYAWSTGSDADEITVSQPGLIGLEVVDSNGCSATDTVEVSLNPEDTTFAFTSSCNPQDTGISTQTLTNQFGCDSVVITTTSLVPIIETFLSASSCDPAEVGIDTVLLVTSSGCDSAVITETSLLPSSDTLLFATTCDPLLAGSDTAVLTNQFGCDSVVVTETTLLPSNTTFATDVTCDPDSVRIDSFLLTNQFGCDSLHIVDVSLVVNDTLLIADASCNPADTGVFVQKIPTFRCDSIVITTVSLLPSDETMLVASSCDPAEVGFDTVVLTNQFGCDSTVITETVLVPVIETFFFETTCNPDEAGIDTLVFVSQSGCDSLAITETTLVPTSDTLLFETSCDPADVGTVTVVLTNRFGCDSTVVTETSLLPSSDTLLFATSCDPADVGTVTVVLTNQFGCDSTVVTETSLLPSSDTLLFATSCDPADVGFDTVVLTNQFGCDSTVVTQTTLLPSSDTLLFAGSCDLADVGFDTVVLTNQFGCDSTVVTQTTLLPSSDTLLFATSCDPSDVGTVTVVLTNQFGCDSTVVTETSLLPSNDTLLFATTCNPAEAGTVTVVLTNQFGCDSVVTTETSLLPSSFTTIQPIICPDDSLLVNGSWYSQTNPTGFDTLEAANGCDSVVQVVMQFYPDPVTEVITEVLCAGEQRIINGTVYSQSNPSGTEVLVNPATGCDSVFIEVNLTFNQVSAALQAIEPPCAGRPGALILDQVSGGTPPYSWSVDGGVFQPLDVQPLTIPNQSVGTHTVAVEDALGCSWSGSAQISEGASPLVDLGVDLTLEYGDSIQLNPVINFLYDTLLWNPANLVPCAGCLNPVITPEFGFTLYLTALDANGCEASDQIRITVEKPWRVYFPNIFSPNNDGFNDTFFPSVDLSQVVSINTFQIYDRWGEQVFQATNFQPNQPANGWDGTFRGQALDPGVYVFYAEIQFIDGEVELFEGGVTLVR